MDVHTPEQRSHNMAAIRSKNTKPETKVRSLLHAAGYRFRLHRKDLPGSPDLVLPRYRTTIFVHGCYWHRHPGCRYASDPKSNTEFWQTKFAANVQRDQAAQQALRDLGWKVVIVWECETRDMATLEARLRGELQAPEES